MPWQTITFNDESLTWDNLPPMGELCVVQLTNGRYVVGSRMDGRNPMFTAEDAVGICRWRIDMTTVKKWKLLETNNG